MRANQPWDVRSFILNIIFHHFSSLLQWFCYCACSSLYKLHFTLTQDNYFLSQLRFSLVLTSTPQTTKPHQTKESLLKAKVVFVLNHMLFSFSGYVWSFFWGQCGPTTVNETSSIIQEDKGQRHLKELSGMTSFKYTLCS